MFPMLHCVYYDLLCLLLLLLLSLYCLHVLRMNDFARAEREEQLLGRGHIAEKRPQCKSSDKKVKESDHGGGGVKSSCCFVSLL